VFWLLAREVMILRGHLLANDEEWEKKIDLFMTRDIEYIRAQQEQAKK
jgi:hypothetical protein